jgi:carbon-monoxide dehydrogenase large subunit
MSVRKFGAGQSVKRVEDIRLITGQGRYASDACDDQGALKAAFVRSPYGHARFAIGDLDEAAAMPGVRAIYKAKDFAGLAGLPCLATVDNSDGSEPALKPYPIMAEAEAAHVGDIVAMVVAETAQQARDAAEAIPVTWDALPAVADMEAAIQPGSAAVWDGAPNNIAYDAHVGDKAATDAVFAKAPRKASIRIVNPRVVANYMEPRAARADIDKAGNITLELGSQGVHIIKMLLCEKILNIPADKLRVVTKDVGGGFGTKNMMYREYPLVVEAARRLGAAVAWAGERTEHFLGDAQGRDNITTAEMAMDENGKFLALRVDILGNLGAYLSMFAPYIPWLGASMASGTYDIGALHARVRGVYTHTVPVDAYRGAGRPEAAYVLERLVDVCAREMKMDPAEIRARNFIKQAQMPFHTLTDRDYDVGDFEGAMRACLKKADRAGFDARAAEAKARGKALGFGFASYVECTAWGDGEEGSVTLNKDGTMTVAIGTQSTGQGHETAYAQVVSEQFDLPLDRIRVLQGDSAAIPTGNGTGGSRSIPVGAVMVGRASTKLAATLKELAADKLEAAVADLEIVDGKIRIAGTDRALDLAEIAALPGATADKLKAVEEFVPPSATYPNGTHACEVEIDPETGVIEMKRYTVVDDFGFTLNPLLLAGQVHGGIAQGAGQALTEKAVFDENGQLVTASFMDYGMPRADDFCDFDFETRNIPSNTNPMGLKGAGEAGSIGSTPAVMNAIADALWRWKQVKHIDMPATPYTVYQALNAAA